MRRVTFALIAVLAAGPLAAQPAPSADPIHDLLAGRWEGTGTILGQESRVELTVEHVLESRFTRLVWVSHIGPPPRTQRFEGHAYYPRLEDGVYRATWFDSSGMVRPIEASTGGTADAVVARWGTAATEQGETTYRRLAADRLEIVDRVRGRDGDWREFGRSALTRAR